MVQMFSTGEVGAAAEIVAANYVDHQGLDGRELHGVDGFVFVVGIARSGCAELRVDVIKLAVHDEGVECRLEWRGVRPNGRPETRGTRDNPRHRW